MGVMELIKFALICIDFLAWPVIALGYPLFASIRAVESGSKYHLRKLVTYWIPFALISLFEFAFLKIIQWIPLWSRIRLVSIFDGACHAYQSLVRPVLVGDVQAVMDKLHKLKEEKPRKRETFAVVAEERIKENVCGASEKAITSKHDCKECNDSQGDTQVLELEEKIAEDMSKQAKIAAWVTKVTKAAGSEVKEMTQQESNAKNRHPDAHPLNKPQQQMEWSCDLCKMTTTDEKTLNAHLQGREHKSNCESLKAIKLRAENTGTSLSTIGKLNLSNVEMDAAAGKVKKTAPHKASAENSRPKTPPNKKVDQEWKCDLCEVKTSSEKTLNEHLHGIKHKSKWECLKASEQIAKYTGSSPLITSELYWSNVGFTTYVRETTQIEASGEKCFLENPPIKKVQQEWACDLCKVRTSSEKTLNDHLQGSKHKFRCESLNPNKLDANDTGHSPLATGKLNKGNVEFGAISKEMTPTEASAENSHPKTASTKKVQQEWKCKVKTTSEKTLNDHLQGSRHKISCESLKISELIAKDVRPSPSATCRLNQGNVDFGTCAIETTISEASAKNNCPEIPPKKVQQEWTCDLCKMKTTSEKSLNDHLRASKHKSKCDSLKANELNAKDTGPSPLATGKLNEGNVDFGAIAEETKLIETSGGNSFLETPPTKEVQQEWNCNLCKVKTTSEETLNDHLQGSRHKINCESLKVGEFIAKDTRPSTSAACKLNQGNADFGTCAKEKTPTEASAENSCPETPPTKKVQQEWTCDYCNVKTTSEKMLNDHLQGKKHKSRCESLKASDLSAKERGPLPSAIGQGDV